MALTSADQQRLALILGVMPQPGLATGYPDLVGILQRLYQDRVARIPWVPPTWYESVRDVQAKNPGDLIKLCPGRNLDGSRWANAPSFADTEDKLDVWQKLYDDINSAVMSYAAKQQAAGASKLANLYASAAFWDAAYNTREFVVNLPANIVSRVGSGLSEFVGTFLPDSVKAYAKWITAALLLLVVGGVVLWYRKRLGGLLQAFKGLGRGRA